MTSAEIKAKIEKIKNNKFIPEALKAGQVKKLEAELEKAEKGGGETTPAPKKERKKREKKVKGPKPKLKVEGKDIDDFDCEELIKKARERREKSKSQEKKYRTKPVIEKIAANVSTAISQAIKNVPAEEIKDDLKGTIKDFESLIADGKKFVASFKKVLGEDYNNKEAMADFTELEKFIDKLEKKYSKK